MRIDLEKIQADLSEKYERLKKAACVDAKSDNTAKALVDIVQFSLQFLKDCCAPTRLISKVPDKIYFSFSLRKGRPKFSRSVNKDLFSFNAERRLHHFLKGSLSDIPFNERQRLLYTTAMSYCCASDMLRTGDQKTPATFFECLIGHLFARSFGVNPRTQVEVLRLEEESSTLPTDFIFDIGPAKPKFHVPVKTSTRERVIQVFAHQRVLDGVHGFGKFTGILVCLTETKLDHKSKEVIEICVPRQWNLYQRFIAPMKRFYYFDVPKKYENLTKGDPPMAVLPFAKFFEEVPELISGK